MKRSHKVALIISLFVVVGILAIVVSPFGRMIRAMIADGRNSDRERVQLLYQTDHEALLTACRSLIQQRKSFLSALHGQQDPNQSFIDPRDPKIPQVIFNLKPRDIIATDRNVSIELHGGFDHYGVVAVLKSEDGDSQSSNSIELIPGLRYYDEGLIENGERWKARLRKMRPNEAPAPSW